VSIGGNMDDTLILGAESAIRLANGDILVGSAKNARIQWFDSRGRFVRSVGGRGQGPGEFGRSIYLYQSAGDTIVARDLSNRRFHYVTPTGQVIRTDTLGDPRRALWLYDRFLVEKVPASLSYDRLRATLTRLPLSERDTLRLARVTSDGYVWIRSTPASTTYTIYSPAGVPAGTIDLPPRFDPYQILDTLVLGRWLDEDDVEHVQLRRLIRPTAPT
jgi:hypothetical protein